MDFYKTQTVLKEFHCILGPENFILFNEVALLSCQLNICMFEGIGYLVFKSIKSYALTKAFKKRIINLKY